MVGRGASLDGRLFLGGTDGPNPVPSSGESGELPSILDQVDLTPTRLGEAARNALSEPDDHPLRLSNLQSCLADGRLVAQFILAEKSG
jgi:hypothetical protein